MRLGPVLGLTGGFGSSTVPGRDIMEPELETSRRETRDAFKNRAVLYRLFYEEFSKEIGEERTAEIMKRALYRGGAAKSDRYRAFAERGDFQGVADEFIKSSVCAGALFKPSIAKVDDRSAIIDMAGCPLVDAWREMGLSPEEVARMCEMANATDYGKYEGMGFALTIDSTVARGQDRCRLIIEKK